MELSKEEMETLKKYPLNKRIRMIRVMLCLSQREFARKMHIAPVSVSIWEMGKRRPKLEMVFRIIRTYDLPVELFNDTIDERMDIERVNT